MLFDRSNPMLGRWSRCMWRDFKFDNEDEVSFVWFQMAVIYVVTPKGHTFLPVELQESVKDWLQ